MELADRLFEVTEKYINSQLPIGFAKPQVRGLLVLQYSLLLEALSMQVGEALVEKVKSGTKLTVEEQAVVNAAFVAVMTDTWDILPGHPTHPGSY